MRIAYVRVSTAEQNEQRQIESLKNFGIERWFSEKISGKSTDRPELQAMMDFCRDGDTIYVHDLSRLARNTRDLLTITDTLERKNVKLVSCKEKIDTQTPTGRLMLTMIAAIAEFERQNILERQREGIKIAKSAGKYTGGHKKAINENLFIDCLAAYERRELTKCAMAQKLGISRPTLDRLLAEHN